VTSRTGDGKTALTIFTVYIIPGQAEFGISDIAAGDGKTALTFFYSTAGEGKIALILFYSVLTATRDSLRSRRMASASRMKTSG
jgi:hypothetical protein